MFYDMNITSKQKTTATAFAGDVACTLHTATKTTKTTTTTKVLLVRT
ncbi:hypothetical protein [Terasakiella pusilla]|jgi:hypothetical protein